MTQLEALKQVIHYLEEAVDIFPDKDDKTREYNEKLYNIIKLVEELIKQ